MCDDVVRNIQGEKVYFVLVIEAALMLIVYSGQASMLTHGSKLLLKNVVKHTDTHNRVSINFNPRNIARCGLILMLMMLSATIASVNFFILATVSN